MIFRRYNRNPKNWKHEGDCVIRAISTAECKPWRETYKELTELGLKVCRIPESKQCYEQLLKKNGWEKHKMPRHYGNTRYTVEELIDENPNITMIISVANHLTVAVKGNLVDTWNCKYKSVGNYFTNEMYNDMNDLETVIEEELPEKVRKVRL